MKKVAFLITCVAILLIGCQQQAKNYDISAQLLAEYHIFDTTQYAQCHASSIIETNEGLLLSFFGGPYERHPNVSIYTSVFENNNWSKPQMVADGKTDTIRYPTWNPVLFRNNDTLITLYYKAGPSPNDWWGLFMNSDNEGITWTKPQELPKGILGPIRNKPVRLPSGVILSPSSTEPNHELWKSHVERSTDNGLSWQKINIPSPDSVKVIQPTLLLYPNNRIQALLRSNQNVIMESWSEDEGLTWSEVQATTIRHPNSGIDATSLFSGAKLLVNNPMKSGKSWEAGRNQLDLYFSADGKEWKSILQLENETEGEFSYPCIIQSRDGLIHISYTYNRTKIKHLVLRLSKHALSSSPSPHQSN
ncbi:sialidase family protein [uncultured Draconibacterium sp.]|uniref:sialidase family protein n=1 Tax=uncultured Draconibacterium sp. TaxID=1573823 RepID=UPI003261A302